MSKAVAVHVHQLNNFASLSRRIVCARHSYPRFRLLICTTVYLYNWACAPIDGGGRSTLSKQSAGIGVVML